MPIRHTIQTIARVFIAIAILTGRASAATIAPTRDSVPGDLLVKMRPGVSRELIANLKSVAGVDHSEVVSETKSGTILLFHSSSKNSNSLSAAIRGNSNV